MKEKNQVIHCRSARWCPGSMLTNKQISLEAKALWAILNDWKTDITPEIIAEHTGESVEKIKNLLKELLNNKYLTMIHRDDGWDYKLCDPSITGKKPVGWASCPCRPKRSDYDTDEAFESAFYTWNSY